jgi:hypothetical protein
MLLDEDTLILSQILAMGTAGCAERTQAAAVLFALHSRQPYGDRQNYGDGQEELSIGPRQVL